MKALITKRNTLSFEQWKERLNPIIRGKYNYFLISARACLEVKKKLGFKFHGYCFYDYMSLDGYIRQRLRVNFSCRGKKHGGQRQGKLLTLKFNNEFFIKDMGLVNGRYLYNLVFNPNLTIKEFIASGKHKNTTEFNDTKPRFFKYALAK